MTSRIVELRAENFKRLKAVRIRPDGAVFEIGGRNGQGKSSVLDAIAAALGGGRSSPTLPIRKGEDRAEVVVELDDLVVRRRWTESGSYLEVASKDGAVFKSPQAMLDKVVGDLSFDPLAFSRMKPADQAATLAKVAGVDLAAYEATRGTMYGKRTEANRDWKKAVMALNDHPAPADDCPQERVDVAAMVEELNAAERTQQEMLKAENASRSEQQRVADQKERIRKLKAEMEAAVDLLLTMQHSMSQADDWVERAKAAAIDTAPIKARIADADRINRQVDAAAEYRRRMDIAKARETEADNADKALAAHDREFRRTLSAARLPVAGLCIDGGSVTLDGVPFEQASSAEQLRTSVAIGLALNPGLRLMLVHDGSLLDGDSMAELARIAEAHDAQVLVERVGGDVRCGVVIEDGEVAGSAEPAVIGADEGGSA